MIKKIKTLFLILFITNGCTSIESSNRVESFNMPINLSSQPRVYLKFNVPEGFTAHMEDIRNFFLGKSIEIYIRPTPPINDVIFSTLYKTDKVTLPNELYSVFMLNGGVTLEELIDRYLNIHTTLASQFYIFNKSFKDHGKFKSASGFVEIRDIDGSVRLIYIEIYSGAPHIAGIVYSEKVKDWLAGEDLMRKAREINNKVDQNIFFIESQ
jgi:hypothetical protein